MFDLQEDLTLTGGELKFALNSACTQRKVSYIESNSWFWFDQEWAYRSALFVCVAHGLLVAFVNAASAWTQMTQHMDERFTRETGQAAGIAELANPVLQELGFDLVRVKLSGQDGNTVQIMIERKDRQVTIEDCTAVSRGLSPVFDAYDPIPGGYFLEVSSPGIDRPLVRPRDFVAWAGHQARIELKELVDGRRRFKGRIEGFEDGEVLLRVELDGYDEPQTIGLSVDLIDEAKLTVNDASIKKALRNKPGK